MEPVKFTTVVFPTHDGREIYRMWAIIPDDGTDGFIVGEWDSVLAVHQALGRLIETGQADEEVDELDERLGHRWLSVSEASKEFNTPADTIRHAARNGHIRLAKKDGEQWRFPQRTFLGWLKNTYTPKSM